MVYHMFVSDGRGQNHPLGLEGLKSPQFALPSRFETRHQAWAAGHTRESVELLYFSHPWLVLFYLLAEKVRLMINDDAVTYRRNKDIPVFSWRSTLQFCFINQHPGSQVLLIRAQKYVTVGAEAWSSIHWFCSSTLSLFISLNSHFKIYNLFQVFSGEVSQTSKQSGVTQLQNNFAI